MFSIRRFSRLLSIVLLNLIALSIIPVTTAESASLFSHTFDHDNNVRKINSSAQINQIFSPKQGTLTAVGCTGIRALLTSSYNCYLFQIGALTTSPKELYLPELSFPADVGMLAVDVCKQDGRFVFAASTSGITSLLTVTGQIFVADHDGSHVVQITQDSADDSWPVWSTDCSQIVFHSNRDGNYQIYRMSPDGTGVLRLTPDGFRNRYPTFSPDGQKIYYQSTKSGSVQVYVMNTDGSNVHQLTTDGGNGSPIPSPDGKFIAFWSTRDQVGDANSSEGLDDQLYVMLADGSHQTRILSDQANVYPIAWSPDSEQLVFIIHDVANARDTSAVIDLKTNDIFAVNWSAIGGGLVFPGSSASWYGGVPVKLGTPTATFTPSMTLTASLTYTPSDTPTASDTPSVTSTPSDTATPTITLTPSETLTPSLTLTPSITPTPTATPVPPPLQLANSAQVIKPDGLQVHTATSKNATVIDTLTQGSIITLVNGPRKIGKDTWWGILTPIGDYGWVQEKSDQAVYLIFASQIMTCPGIVDSRLIIGHKGRVTPGDPNYINSLPSPPSQDPNSHHIGSIPEGGIFSVLAGPVCNKGIAWWQVNYRGTIGWTGEAQGDTYWVEPVSG